MGLPRHGQQLADVVRAMRGKHSEALAPDPDVEANGCEVEGIELVASQGGAVSMSD